MILHSFALRGEVLGPGHRDGGPEFYRPRYPSGQAMPRRTPCIRCGHAILVRNLHHTGICLDCRESDPEYVKMVATELES